jgi:hypothetical protein
MRQGPSPRRVRELSQQFGADLRTIRRWRDFWRDLVPQTTFWKVARARLVPALDATALLPRALYEAFLHGDDDQPGWERLLRFLAPITITGGLKIAGSA